MLPKLSSGLVCFSKAVVTIVLMASSVKAIQITGYEPAKHDRFYIPTGQNLPKQFVASQYDFSGVGRSNRDVVSPAPFATLITGRYFLSSAHANPSDYPDDNIRFYQSNDPSEAFWDGEVDSSFSIPISNSDVWIGRFTTLPPAWAKRYPIIIRPNLSDYTTYTTEINKTLVKYGWGNNSYGPAGATSTAVGFNQIDQYFESTFAYDYNVGAIANEAHSRGGDSGSPSFAIGPTGSLAVAGITWGRGQFSSTSYSNTDSNVGAFASEITLAILQASGGARRPSYVTDLVGDFNADLTVDFTDIGILSTNYGGPDVYNYWQGDLTGDGAVDNFDYWILASNYGKTLGSPATNNSSFRADSFEIVPEPAAITLLASVLILAGVCVRRSH